MNADEKMMWNEMVIKEYAKLKTDEGIRFEHAIIVGWLTAHMTDKQRKYMINQIKELKK